MIGEGAYPPGVTGDMIPEGPDDMWIPEPCCDNCEHFDGDYCTREWNNMDRECCVPDRDERDAYDCCDDYSWNGETLEYPRKPEKPVRRPNQTDMQWKWTMRYYRRDMNKWREAMLIIKREKGEDEE